MKRHNTHSGKRSQSYQRVAQAIRNHRRTLSDKYKVSEIGIFGSTARGGQNGTSDIDILVDFREVPDLLKFVELELYLEKLLKRKVDLVDKQGLRSELRDDILNEVVYV